MDIVFILFVVGMIIYSKFFNKKAKIKRKLKKAVLTSVGLMNNGDVAKIIGKVHIIKEPLMSPFSKRQCALYYVHVEALMDETWETVIEEEVATTFLVKDGDHYAFLKDSANHKQCLVVQDREFKSGYRNDATQVLESYLKSKGEKSVGWFGYNKTLRYKEGIIENHETVALLGQGHWKDAVQLGLSGRYGKVLEITSTADISLHLSNDPETTDNGFSFDLTAQHKSSKLFKQPNNNSL